MYLNLTKFVEMGDVIDKVKPLRPKPPRRIAAALQVVPRSNRYPMVGTAFDYLLRFELQRSAPHAVAERWVAERACDLLWKETATGAVGLDLLSHGPDPDYYLPPEEVSKRARAIVANVKAAVTAFLTTKAPKRTQFAELAVHAIRLAKLDVVVRVHQLDPRFEEADAEDVEDLLAMLKIVPFDSLLHGKILLLNPHFKESSEAAGGSDADLIAGDLLVDFKVTKKSEMDVKHLDELLGYFLLTRHHRRLDPTTFPEIMRVALYFCRHGHLWLRDVTMWTEHPDFLEIEEWFFKRAKEVFEESRAIANADIASGAG